jgi:hypothetical protein
MHTKRKTIIPAREATTQSKRRPPKKQAVIPNAISAAATMKGLFWMY